jgi:hypothetical protein
VNEQEQRITIAKVCGWTDIKPHAHIIEGWPDILAGMHSGHKCERAIPDFLCDLNAMHEAEKVLGGIHDYRWCGYIAELETLTVGSSRISATATQRAEAFLRTFNLWKE